MSMIVFAPADIEPMSEFGLNVFADLETGAEF